MLVAGTHRAIELLEGLLREDAELVSARSVREALARLDEGDYDTIACNVRFDESRMFELLTAAKTQPVTRQTPFVCFRLATLPAPWRRCLEAAVLAIGAAAFVDLSSLERERGRDAAEQRLRDIVLEQLRSRP